MSVTADAIISIGLDDIARLLPLPADWRLTGVSPGQIRVAVVFEDGPVGCGSPLELTGAYVRRHDGTIALDRLGLA